MQVVFKKQALDDNTMILAISYDMKYIYYIYVPYEMQEYLLQILFESIHYDRY